jgi:hypothetical protein
MLYELNKGNTAQWEVWQIVLIGIGDNKING